MDEDGKHAGLHAKAVPVIDQFVFLGPNMVPATVSFNVRWDALGPPVGRGKSKAVASIDPAAFLGEFSPARSTAVFSGAELGASSDRGFAQLGKERNGSFL